MQRFMRLGTLVLLQVVIVGNLQVLPANALYGFSLPFLYLIAGVLFFYPCLLLVKTLAIAYPQTGGAYLWTQAAFGKKFGFYIASILWLSNLLWYPSILALTAVNVAYIVQPVWAQSKIFVFGFSIILFWGFTLLNCLGIKISAWVSSISCLVGIILPMLILIGCGVIWAAQGHPLATTLSATPIIPDLWHLNNVNYVIAIVVSLFGVEIYAVHAAEVVNPARNFPLSLIIAAIILLVLLIGAELAISIIIPAKELNVLSGVLDTFVRFFKNVHLPQLITPVLLLVLFGNIGSISAWMLGSTRGMLIAVQHNRLAYFLQKRNSHNAPIGILFLEAIIFTVVAGLFLNFPNVADSFWLLLVLASQLTLVYYIGLFISAIKLIPQMHFNNSTAVVYRTWMLIGAITAFSSVIIGFISPSNLTGDQQLEYKLLVMGGLIVCLLLPGLLLLTRNR